jgi:hypothetical protein
MTWPHRLADARWIGRFRWLCAASVIAALCWPGLNLSQRFVTGVFGLFALAGGFLTYGLILFLVRGVPLLNRGLALLVFYVTLTSVLLLPFQYLYEAWVGVLPAVGTGATEFALTLPANLGALAAAFNALQRTARWEMSAR